MQKPEEKSFVENLINEIGLPPDAKVGETPENYKKRTEYEKEQKSKINNSKNQ